MIWGIEGKVPHLNFGNRQMQVSGFTSRLLYFRLRTSVPCYIGRWAGHSVGLDFFLRKEFLHFRWESKVGFCVIQPVVQSLYLNMPSPLL